MKVILVNGSPREKGCTYTALCEVAGALEKNGIETEIFQVGAKPIAGCIGCNVCLKNGRCFVDDPVNEFVEKAKTADGFVFGSPVHYAAASGAITKSSGMPIKSTMRSRRLLRSLLRRLRLFSSYLRRSWRLYFSSCSSRIAPSSHLSVHSVVLSLRFHARLFFISHNYFRDFLQNFYYIFVAFFQNKCYTLSRKKKGGVSR